MNYLIQSIKDDKSNAINLFLFFIYTYGDKTIKNEEKSKYYKILIHDILEIDYIKTIISYEFGDITCELVFYQRLKQFLKSYDLEYVSNKFVANDFIFYMSKGTFHEPNYYNESNIIQTKINEEFYNGFFNS